MKQPGVFHIDHLADYEENKRLDSGRWCKARPVSDKGFRKRLRATWLVFTGKADAVTWTEQ